MISFSCPQCRTTYRFPDARAGDRIACSKCKYPVQIPPASVETGPRPAAPPIPKPPPIPSSVVAPSAPVPPKVPVAPPPVPASVVRPAPPPIPASNINPPPIPSKVAPAPPPFPVSQVRPPTAPQGTKQWYYEDGPDVVGPVPESELRAAANNDRLVPDARVWSDSMVDWQPVTEVFPGLFDGRATRPKPDTQTKVAAALAAVAVCSLLVFVVVYAVKGGRKSEPTKSAVAGSVLLTERVRT